MELVTEVNKSHWGLSFLMSHVQSGQLRGEWRHVYRTNVKLAYYVYLSGVLFTVQQVGVKNQPVALTLSTACLSALGIVAPHGFQLLQLQQSSRLKAQKQAIWQLQYQKQSNRRLTGSRLLTGFDSKHR